MKHEKIREAFATLAEVAIQLLDGGAAAPAEATDSKPEKAAKADKKGKGKTEKAAKADKKGKGEKAKADGPSIDEVRKACLELIELVDENSEDEDGNVVLFELIQETLEDDSVEKLAEIENEPEKLQAVLDAVKEYISDHQPEDDE